MIIFTTKSSFYVTFCTITALLLAFAGETAFGQTCNCPPNMCLSKWGFCGTGDAWCGEGCQCGPCNAMTAETTLGQNCSCPPNTCLSKWGFCGTGDAWCGEGCQCGPCKAVTSETTLGQTCSCPPNMCLSQWGFCGTGDAWCGPGCQCGPCNAMTNNISVSDIVTDAFFSGIVNATGADYPGKKLYSQKTHHQVLETFPRSNNFARREIAATINGGVVNSADCPGKKFYSRKTFIQALDTFPRFASGSDDVARREIAAFFAHVTHETGSLCYTKEIDGASLNYCDPGFKQYPCAPGKKYFGRGPIQISWNYNYVAAGQSIGFDGLDDPDIVARDPVISFKTALWFWMNNNCHTAITSGQGFGATIRAINSMECNGGNTETVNNRVKYYKNYCSQLGVDPGANMHC